MPDTGQEHRKWPVLHDGTPWIEAAPSGTSGLYAAPREV